MAKVTLKMDDFKALASDSRLDIIKILDGKKMGLKELAKETNLNKMTLHEHLNRLVETGFVKRIQRKGHKWVYYQLTWKGSSLIHPDNTKVVLLFSTTIFTFLLGFIGVVNVIRNYIDSQYFIEKTERGINYPWKGPLPLNNGHKIAEGGSEDLLFGQEPIVIYLLIICFVIFSILLAYSFKRYKRNKIARV